MGEGDAFAADLASGLVCKLVSLATEEVIQAWNLQDDLITLRERLETIDALFSDAATKKLTKSAVEKWFSKLEAMAHVAEAFIDQLANYTKIAQHAKNSSLQLSTVRWL